jgi:O-antigen/teichoic acid export membrane protein
VASGIQLARLLGPEGRGELAAVLLWPMIVGTFGTLGLTDSVTYAAAARKIVSQDLVASAGTLAIAISLPLMGVAYFLMPVLFARSGPEIIQAAQLYTAIIPVTLLGTFLLGAFQGTFRMVQWNLLRGSVHVLYPAGVALLWWTGRVSVLGCAMASLTASCLASVLIVAFALHNGWLGSKPKLAHMRELVAYGINVYIPNIVQLINERSDQAILSLLLSPADLGLYVVAVTIVRGAAILTSTLQYLALPAIANCALSSEKTATADRFIGLNALISIATAIGVAATARELVRFAFGPAYLPSLTIIYILLFAGLAMNTKSMINTVFKGYNKALHITKAELVGLIATLAVLPLLIHLFATIGAAFSAVVVQFLTCAIIAYTGHCLFNIDLRRLFGPTLNDIVWMLNRLAVRITFYERRCLKGD